MTGFAHTNATSLARSVARTPFGAIAAVARRAANDGSQVVWPSPRWRDDPVGFARDVLGIELWRAQVEILEAIRDHRNVTVRSGHKCGKSTALAVAALWFYCSFERARVLLTAVKASQIDEVIWKEVRRLYREAKRRIPIGGEMFVLARTGLRDDDERQIWGITARDGEGLAGISGPNNLVLCDEASGIRDDFFEVLGSTLAGSGGVARKCYISNPTRTRGEFYRSHTTNAHLFKCIHVSSEDTPNARGEKLIPGLAGAEWIAERRLEYGPDSPQYRIRVKGEFVADLDGKINSLEILAAAQQAWDEAPDAGRLQIGIDPAGDGVKGDESAHAVRRGMKIVTVLAERGLSEDAIIARTLDLLRTYRRPREPKPRIAIDCGGGIGTRVFGKLQAYLDTHPDAFELLEVRGEKIFWGSVDYHTVRDGLWGHGCEWLKAGGALPENAKLEQELNAPRFSLVPGKDKNERYAATSKDELRKELGRSPDRADAVNLACWKWHTDAVIQDAAPKPKPRRAADPLDAYGDDDAGIDHDRVFDPYGGAP